MIRPIAPRTLVRAASLATWNLGAWLLAGTTAFADPLDYDSYVRQDPRDFWMSRGDFGWLLMDYGLFALSIVAAGWVARKRPDLWLAVERRLRAPLAALRAAADARGGWDSVTGTLLHAGRILLGVLMLAAWVFVCQWLRHIGLGALAMAGLALAGLVLVRSLRAAEHPA